MRNLFLRLGDEKRKRYFNIKRRMREGEFVPREDFLFMKDIDQHMNYRRGVLHNLPPEKGLTTGRGHFNP